MNDGLCSIDQADLIQSAVEKKLIKIYKIDEFQGKSLSKSLVSYDDNEDDMNDDDDNTSEKKISNDDKSNNQIGGTNASKSEVKSDSKTINNEISPSSHKSNLSPGEVKPVSPSSLSEASPISN